MTSRRSAARTESLQLAIVLWRGDLGGAENVSAAIAREWRRVGVNASVVFVTGAGLLAARLRADVVPQTALGLARGREALRYPSRLAAVVAQVGADGVLLVDAGRLAGVLRFGGYRGRIVGVEHGDVLAVATLPLPLRVKDRLERWVGARFRFADVGVSDFVAAEMHRRPHASRLYRIHNGVDTSLYRPHRADAPSSESRLTIGCAARLVRGKGVDRLLAAVGRLSRDTVRVLVAGDGPEQESLEKLARTLGLADIVTFLGAVEDMPGFWRSCDVAVVPSEALESFSMATLEAMASGIPVVATSVGGIPEVLVHGETGTIVPPRDADALAHAIRSYAEQPARRVQEGRAGRLRACRLFSIETAAARYLELFKEDRTS